MSHHLKEALGILAALCIFTTMAAGLYGASQATPPGGTVVGASGTDYSCRSADDPTLRQTTDMLADAAGWPRPLAVNSYPGQRDGVGYFAMRFERGVAVFTAYVPNGGSTATGWMVPVNPLGHELFRALPSNLQTGMTINSPGGIHDSDYLAVVGHLTDCVS
jgi:hypothetical protein